MTALCDAALTYAARGRPVFPCEPQGKRPLTVHGLHEASTDPAVITAWWRHWPSANVGLVTGQASGLVVLDVDGEQGEASVLELQRQAGAPLPATLWARTPRGGWHAYFRHPEGEHIPNSAGQLAPGVDVRGTGGYVVTAPSVGANGEPYYWAVRAPVAPLPGWLLDRLRPRVVERPPRPVTVVGSGYGVAALRGEAEEVLRTAPGGRNHRLFLAAARCGELVAGGLLDEGGTVALLAAAGVAAGLAERETRQTIASGLRHGMAQPRAVAVVS